MSVRNRYEQELAKIKADIIRLAAKVEDSVRGAIAAIVNRDRDLAEKILGAGKEIASAEAAIETSCFQILLRQQPVAGDFREVSAALKIITDLERMGHQAADIAELALGLPREGYVKPAEHFPQMAEIAARMAVESVDAYVHANIPLAKSVYARDDELDALFLKVTAELVALIRADDANLEQGILFLMIAKYFERIGDHAAHISDWVVYDGTGRHLRPKYQQPLEQSDE